MVRDILLLSLTFTGPSSFLPRSFISSIRPAEPVFKNLAMFLKCLGAGWFRRNANYNHKMGLRRTAQERIWRGQTIKAGTRRYMIVI